MTTGVAVKGCCCESAGCPRAGGRGARCCPPGCMSPRLPARRGSRSCLRGSGGSLGGCGRAATGAGHTRGRVAAFRAGRFASRPGKENAGGAADTCRPGGRGRRHANLRPAGPEPGRGPFPGSALRARQARQAGPARPRAAPGRRALRREGGPDAARAGGQGVTWTLESWTRHSCCWILCSSSCCHRMLACSTRVRCSSWSRRVWNTLAGAGSFAVEVETTG